MAKPLDHRHFHPGLPRFWISIPRSVVRRAHEDPLLRGLFPSHVGFFPRASAHRISREQGIDSTIFNYCVKGRGWCSVGGARHAVRAGDLAVIPSGEPHAYGSSSEAPWTLHWFHAMGTHLPRLLEHLGVTAASPVVRLTRLPELEALFTEVREALEDDYSDQQLLYGAQTLTYLIGVMIRRRRSQARAEPTALDRVRASIEFMKRHLADALDVTRLAAVADLSPSHYSELVRASTGYPPKEYLTRLRMHRAAQLLDTTELSVTAIAGAVGFADPLHFSRVFRRINERSPRHYRAERSRAGRG